MTAATQELAGRMLKEHQLAMFEAREHAFLERCRALAVELARRHGQVCINDIRAAIEVPPGVHPSVLGAVFRTRTFQAIGYTEATHAAAHARIVRVYTLRKE
jgi:hypothetical protein